MTFAAAFLLALAQPATTPPAQPPQDVEVAVAPQVQTALDRATVALGNCYETELARVSPSTTPEAGGEQVRAACATQIGAIEQITIQMITANPQASPMQKNAAIVQVRQRFALIPSTLADMIRETRAQAARIQ